MVKDIVWRKKANEDFRKLIENIKSESWSIGIGEQIKNKTLDKISQLSTQAERHPLDRFKNENDGSFRAFEHKSLRISYRVREVQIQILMARHVKMKPKYH